MFSPAPWVVLVLLMLLALMTVSPSRRDVRVGGAEQGPTCQVGWVAEARR